MPKVECNQTPELQLRVHLALSFQHIRQVCEGSLTLSRYLFDVFLTALLHETFVFDTHYVGDSFRYVLTLFRKPCKYVGFRQTNRFFEHAHSAHMLDSAIETH